MNNKPRILVVDDVSSNIHLLMNILKDKYTIIAATNAKKALQLAKKEPMPDIILTDIIMPEMDGYALCNEIKNDKNTSHIPVIFITSLNGLEEQEKALEQGGIDFITKPFSKDLVLDTVEIHLREQVYLHKNKQDYIQGKNMKNCKPSILIVDDSPENLQVMIEVLKQDYQVSVATSGEKALSMLSNELTPDLILLDVVMPHMDGYEVCERLKSQDSLRHIPVIFVTVLEKEKDVIKGLKLGAVDYVVKPIEPVVLKARIQTHLKLKIYQDQLMNEIKSKDELLLSQSKLALLGEMFENIAHQWKQPLSAITVTTSGIKFQKEYGSLNDEKLNMGLDTIDESVKYLSNTVDDFRNFLKNDAKKNTFNLKKVVDKTIKLLNSKLQISDINIENLVLDIEITSYQNDLIQILMNILTNAQDALMNIKNDRKIEIKSMCENNQIIISVKDNAGGIKLDNIEKVFEKYFTTKSNIGGSGVGLFMSQKIVTERLAGEIKVCNQNHGACFEICFPH